MGKRKRYSKTFKLESMAESIKKVGLLNPILIGKHDGKMHLINGRNRHEACKLAGVDPETKILNGQDMSEVIIGG